MVIDEVTAAATSLSISKIRSSSSREKARVFDFLLQELISQVEDSAAQGKRAKFEYVYVDGKERRFSNLSFENPFSEDSTACIIRRLQVLERCLERLNQAARSWRIFKCSLRESVEHVWNREISNQIEAERVVKESRFECIKALAANYDMLNEEVVVVKGPSQSFILKGLSI